MASYYKLKSGAWRAQIDRAGVRDSATRDTKAEATAWATVREADILAGARGVIVPKRFSEVLQRYAREVSSTKAGERWEKIRLKKIEDQCGFAGKMVADVTPTDIASWRDWSLRSGGKNGAPLANGTVRREMNLLRSVFEQCRKEWGYVRVNPCADVRRPADGAARVRRISEDEISKVLEALGWDRHSAPALQREKVAVAFLIAIETGMRAGEIVKLARSRLKLHERCATVANKDRKDEVTTRNVALNGEAVRLFKLLPTLEGSELVLGVTSANLDALFRKAIGRTDIEDLHFHDTRHEACTRLARKLSILDLAAQIGHRDLRSLQIYYNPTASEIADRIDGVRQPARKRRGGLRD